MNYITLIILIFLCNACQQASKPKEGWHTIVIGKYALDFPSDFKIETEKGIDSYVGKIKGDSIVFQFDYGYYSNDLGQTQDEYVASNYWRDEPSYQFYEDGVLYTEFNKPPKAKILSIRPASKNDSIIGKGCDYIAKCQYKNNTFNYPVYLPESIKQTKFKIDTLDKQIIKIAQSSTSTGTTGLYTYNLRDYSESMRSYKALVLGANDLNKYQQKLAVSIFSTIRINKQK